MSESLRVTARVDYSCAPHTSGSSKAGSNFFVILPVFFSFFFVGQVLMVGLSLQDAVLN